MKTSLFGPGFPDALLEAHRRFDLRLRLLVNDKVTVYSDSGLLISRCLKGHSRYWLLSRRDKGFNQKRIISGDCRSRSLLGDIVLSLASRFLIEHS
jgi:hypothetical protein